MKFHIRNKETLKASREGKKKKPYIEAQEVKWKTMEQCLQNSENKYFYLHLYSNQPLSEEWEEKGHFQMCQVLEATVACPSPFYGEREGREARRQGSRKGEKANSHLAAGQRVRRASRKDSTRGVRKVRATYGV